MNDKHRRAFIKYLAASTGVALGQPLTSANAATPVIRKQLPRHTQSISAIGMGTWITFDVPSDSTVRKQRTNVLRTFFDLGGEMIDSSPMYGMSEDMLGHALQRISNADDLFAASKIWTPFAFDGREQMSNSESLWGIDQLDLMYVHNLLNWKKHLPQLQKWKFEGRIRFTGLSTSHGRRHTELEKLIKTEQFDFVQLTLNIDQTTAEDRLIPLAADHGVAVVVNRPFARGALIRKYESRSLPGIAKELGCRYWSQFLLLYIISHPAVTCTIPATSKVAHMKENMGTLNLELPDESARAEMRRSIQ